MTTFTNPTKNLNNKHVSIGYLNNQSMISSFDKFQLIFHAEQFDILTLPETWIKDENHIPKCVETPGYKFSCRNRNERQGGVRLYIKDSVEHKWYHDFNKINETAEHAWIECRGNNRIKSYLIQVLYRLHLAERKKTDADRKTGHCSLHDHYHFGKNDHHDWRYKYWLHKTFSSTYTINRFLKHTIWSSTLPYQYVKTLKPSII